MPLSFPPDEWAPYAALAGVSLSARVTCGKQSFHDDLLFTHRGLSGPAILQISSHWEHGQPLVIDLRPDIDLDVLFSARRSDKVLLNNLLAQHLPRRLAEVFVDRYAKNLPRAQCNEKSLRQLAAALRGWRILPGGTMGHAKAEVTCGGVDTPHSPRKPWLARRFRGCISSVRWWMSPASSVTTTCTGPGHRAMLPGGWCEGSVG